MFFELDFLELIPFILFFLRAFFVRDEIWVVFEAMSGFVLRNAS